MKSAGGRPSVFAHMDLPVQWLLFSSLNCIPHTALSSLQGCNGGKKQYIFHCLGTICVLLRLTLAFSKYEAWSLKCITIIAFWSFHYLHINSFFSVHIRPDKTSSQLSSTKWPWELPGRTLFHHPLWLHENERTIRSRITYHRRLNRRIVLMSSSGAFDERIPSSVSFFCKELPIYCY